MACAGGLPCKLLAHLHTVRPNGDLGGEGFLGNVLLELVETGAHRGAFLRDLEKLLANEPHLGADVDW